MGVSFVYNDNSSLRDIKELIDSEQNPNSKVSSSMEELNTIPKESKVSNDGCGDVGEQPKQQPIVYFTKVINEDSKSFSWTFILGTCFYSVKYTDFVLLMAEVKPQDKVLIYGPSTCSLNTANFLSGAVLSCKSKDVSICIPYIFNLGAAYFLSFAKKIIHSPYDIMVCKQDDIIVGGQHLDAKSSLYMHKSSNETMINRLRNKGLLTDKEVDHILNAQGQTVCYCKELAKRYLEFNNSK